MAVVFAGAKILIFQQITTEVCAALAGLSVVFAGAKILIFQQITTELFKGVDEK